MAALWLLCVFTLWILKNHNHISRVPNSALILTRKLLGLYLDRTGVTTQDAAHLLFSQLTRMLGNVRL
jgi:hypothetical protein